MPTLWGFMDFNYASSNADDAIHDLDDSITGDSGEEPAAKPKLTPAPWPYPDDCCYLPMYV